MCQDFKEKTQLSSIFYNYVRSKEEEDLIEVKNLTKKYGDHIAVNNLSFEVKQGQIYGFLGPNGAGKSTTMNIMTGYLSATEGEIIINGHSIFDEPEEAKKHIGYLPELPPLYMDMTPIEYLRFVAELKKVPDKDVDQMLDDIMKTVKITEVANRLIKNLSKGYKQRVGLAQALVGYPEVLILDEPTVGLDPKQIIEIRDLIKSLGEKHTVILSSHILSEVSAVCDHVMIIAHGQLVASDSPENLSKIIVAYNTLELTIKGDTDKVKGLLDGIEGIDEIEIHSSLDKDCVDFVIKTANDVDVREVIFKKMSDAGCPILKMALCNMSLEDVFIQLTSDKKWIINKEKKEKKKLFGKKADREETENVSDL